MDFAGPIQGKMYLLVVDVHSKWPEVYDMHSSTTSEHTITMLRHLFAMYRLPLQLVSDNGPQCISSDLAEFMKKNGIKHTRCASYHPSSNGHAECFVRTLSKQ